MNQIRKNMILTSKIFQNNKFTAIALLVIISLFTFAATANAQSALSLSVSPTLFEMSANPTQEWTSQVRVINPNPYEITVFANVVNFAPQGEVGQGKFVPIIDEETKGQTIAEWVEVSADPIVVPAEKAIEVPFVIKVPEDAPPGGHYAALLIGTKPPKEEGAALVKTSQIVTTLLFLRVTGDVIESGNIRSFRTLDSVLERPEATFELRFENNGNVHILPQGEIRIKNMWGQERGVVPVNRTILFGNVLPDSIRKYTFTWTGEWSLADMGRYTAVAALAYGEDGRNFSSSETAFWVIPYKMLTVMLLVITGFIAFFTWAIKLYIRKMLSMAGVAPGVKAASSSRQKMSVVVAPIEAGMLDLRGQWQQTTTWTERIEALVDFIKKYRTFFVALLLTLVFFVGAYSYIKSASESERAFNITVDGLSEEVQVSSEEIKYQQLKESSTPEQSTQDTDLPSIVIVNRSGVSGLAADLRIKLEKDGYEILEIKNDLDVAEKNTVIVYDPSQAEEALALSQKVYGALLSAFSEPSGSDMPITIYVGQDLENAVQ